MIVQTTHSCVLCLAKWSKSGFQNVTWYYLRNFQNQFFSQRSNSGKVLFLSIVQVNNTFPRDLEAWYSDCDRDTLGVCRDFPGVCGDTENFKGINFQILHFLKSICLQCNLGSVDILFSHLSLQCHHSPKFIQERQTSYLP